MKFTPDGGSICFETDYRSGADDRHIIVRYRITDTGVGMSEVFLEKVFDYFAQEETGARTQYPVQGYGSGHGYYKAVCGADERHHLG